MYFYKSLKSIKYDLQNEPFMCFLFESLFGKGQPNFLFIFLFPSLQTDIFSEQGQGSVIQDLDQDYENSVPLQCLPLMDPLMPTLDLRTYDL